MKHLVIDKSLLILFDEFLFDFNNFHENRDSMESTVEELLEGLARRVQNSDRKDAAPNPSSSQTEQPLNQTYLLLHR